MSNDSNGKTYVLDINWLVEAMTQYPPDIMPEFWVHLRKLIANEQIIMCDPVYQEIMEQDDELSQWVKTNINGAHVNPSDEDLDFVKEQIMSVYEEKFSKWFDLDEPSGLLADPFIVATAAIRGAVVVTYETGKIMQIGTPISKLPNACEAFDVGCIFKDKHGKQSPIVDFLRDSGYRQ